MMELELTFIVGDTNNDKFVSDEVTRGKLSQDAFLKNLFMKNYLILPMIVRVTAALHSIYKP